MEQTKYKQPRSHSLHMGYWPFLFIVWVLYPSKTESCWFYIFQQNIYISNTPDSGYHKWALLKFNIAFTRTAKVSPTIVDDVSVIAFHVLDIKIYGYILFHLFCPVDVL